MNFLDDDLLGGVQPGDKNRGPDEFRRALVRAGEQAGPRFRDDPAIEANVHLVIGRTLHHLGASADAKREYEEAFSRRAALYGPEHPTTLTTATWLANVCLAAGDIGRAAELAEMVLAVRRGKLGPDHRDTHLAVKEVARVRMFQQRYSEADELLRGVLPALRREFGPTHAATREAVYMRGGLLAFLDRPDESAVAFRQLADIRAAALGEDHAETREALSILAGLYSQMGRADDLEKTVHRLVAAERRATDVDPVSLSSTLTFAGDRLIRLGRPAAAETHILEALALRLKHLPATHWRIASARSLLGEAVAESGSRDAEAEQLLRDGYAGLAAAGVALQADAKGNLADAAGRLATFYTDRGRSAEAATWRAERAKYGREQAPPPRPVK